MAMATSDCLVCGRPYAYYDAAPRHFCSVACEVDAGPVGQQTDTQTDTSQGRGRAAKVVRVALDAQSAVPAPRLKGWTKFSYPKDQDRVPLVTPDGKPYPHEIRGVFQRQGHNLLIQTDQGQQITATMSKWTLAEADLEALGGYVLPEEAQDD